jgi:hypothetical protein
VSIKSKKETIYFSCFFRVILAENEGERMGLEKRAKRPDWWGEN